MYCEGRGGQFASKRGGAVGKQLEGPHSLFKDETASSKRFHRRGGDVMTGGEGKFNRSQKRFFEQGEKAIVDT